MSSPESVSDDNSTNFSSSLLASVKDLNRYLVDGMEGAEIYTNTDGVCSKADVFVESENQWSPKGPYGELTIVEGKVSRIVLNDQLEEDGMISISPESKHGIIISKLGSDNKLGIYDVDGNLRVPYFQGESLFGVDLEPSRIATLNRGRIQNEKITQLDSSKILSEEDFQSILELFAKFRIREAVSSLV